MTSGMESPEVDNEGFLEDAREIVALIRTAARLNRRALLEIRSGFRVEDAEIRLWIPDLVLSAFNLVQEFPDMVISSLRRLFGRLTGQGDT